MRGMLKVGLALALLAGVLCGCDSGGDSAGENQSAVPTRTLQEVAEEVGPAVGISDAAPYQPGPGIHNFIFAGDWAFHTSGFEEDLRAGGGVRRREGMPFGWWAQTVDDIELVVWVKRTGSRDTGVDCRYLPPVGSRSLWVEQYDIAILAAQTGEILDFRAIETEARCPATGSTASSRVTNGPLMVRGNVMDLASSWISQ